MILHGFKYIFLIGADLPTNEDDKKFAYKAVQVILWVSMTFLSILRTRLLVY